METISDILDNQIKMPSDGLKKRDGEMITQLNQLQPQEDRERLLQQQKGISGQKTLTSDEKKKLTRLVTACFDSLKVYGKTSEQLEGIIMLMQMTLNEQPYFAIRSAFQKHLKESSEMPTPHDILNLIQKMKDEAAREFYVEFIKDDEQKKLIRRLGAANYRRQLGVTKQQDPTTYEFLDKWEADNQTTVDWTDLDGWLKKQEAIANGTHIEEI